MADADGRKPSESESRELKVKVPLSMHVHLHSLKILTGRSISDVVTDALASYFDGPGGEDPFEIPADAKRRAFRGDGPEHA